MSLGRASLLLISVLAVSTAGFFAVVQLTGDADRGPTADASVATSVPHYRLVWPASFEDIVRKSRATAYVEVTEVRSGPELVPDSHASAGIPTTRVAVRTLETLSGTAPQTFELFKVEGRNADLEGSPAYEVGERYIVFARPRQGADDGSWITVSPDGWLRETSAGTFDALIPGPVADQLSGDTKSKINATVDAVAQE